MLICIHVKFIFDSVRLGLSSSDNILQIHMSPCSTGCMFKLYDPEI